MIEVRAADLPEGSIIVSRDAAYIKQRTYGTDAPPWSATGTGNCLDDPVIDHLLRYGAEVLRHGYGDDA